MEQVNQARVKNALRNLEISFSKFLAQDQYHSAWLTLERKKKWYNSYFSPNTEVYIRRRINRSTRLVENVRYPTLDIANIIVGLRRGEGVGLAVIKRLHELNPFEVTYIENILEPRFLQKLLSLGWTSDTECQKNPYSLPSVFMFTK